MQSFFQNQKIQIILSLIKQTSLLNCRQQIGQQNQIIFSIKHFFYIFLFNKNLFQFQQILHFQICSFTIIQVFNAYWLKNDKISNQILFQRKKSHDHTTVVHRSLVSQQFPMLRNEELLIILANFSTLQLLGQVTKMRDYGNTSKTQNYPQQIAIIKMKFNKYLYTKIYEKYSHFMQSTFLNQKQILINQFFFVNQKNFNYSFIFFNNQIHFMQLINSKQINQVYLISFKPNLNSINKFFCGENQQKIRIKSICFFYQCQVFGQFLK
ncbi:hypothetical protein TTHERM_000172927 (macronuclear) [Tetrahymena thermophila SB210]|uniref:Uncharacterized protein n=1 Tax=Tetrahymena thermophila (strain SB210) TaxID=312017 RepID=W7XLF6_TETTS|nr:hypothetical protein TTHERM_000172927 [Tetrahymena thermophila SB210]EWS76204.1 hypothetical protein TTHERM_000172927 [Tetrahymena thermophila SB210]|eukprot:XP_012651251.1 hypothetical protein TTHERM_000172927 [Tetrahymena thermophila SB210]